MTLETLIYNIGELALKKNLVNAYFAGGSLYELNAETINEYPIIFLTPAGDHTVKENTTRFSLTIYYADRLWDDDRNETDICSAAIETLKNLMRQISYLDWVAYVQEEPSIRLFTETERMNDRVAGAYMQIWVEVLNASTCPEFLDELGRPMGNYIPGNINVLDSYATKAWVILQKYADKPWVLEQIENIKMSGGTTDKQVLEMIASALTEYTKTNGFATINNSAITEGGDFQLVERSEFNNYSAMTAGELEKIIELIGNIPMSSVTENIAALSSVTNSHTENISTLSALTNSHTEDIAALSSVTNNHTEGISSLSSVTNSHTEDINALSALTSSHTQDIISLSAKTSAITEDLGVLSGYTHESVSSITHSVETLSAGTETAISGLSNSVSELSASTQTAIYGFTEELAALAASQKLALFNMLTDYGTGQTEITRLYEDVTAAMAKGKTAAIIAEFWDSENRGVSNPFIAQVYESSTAYLNAWGFSAVFYYGDLQIAYGSIYFNQNGFGNLVVRNGHYYFKPLQKIKNYTLPTASAKVLGGVKVGSGLTMTNQVLSTQYQIWAGTQEAYDALGTYDSKTLYVITGLN